MKIKHQVVVFDAAELPAESEFWAGLLSGTAAAEDEVHMVLVDGAPRIAQLSAGHIPPDWPDGSPPQQLQLDLLGGRYRGGARRGTSRGTSCCAGCRRWRQPGRLPGVRRAIGTARVNGSRILVLPDLTTTVLTMTLTGIAADLPTGNRRSTLARRLLAVATMLAGAAAGALLVLRISPVAALGLATGLLALVTVGAAAPTRSTGAWRTA